MSESNPSPGFKYQKLRIAWSVGCGIVCLLLIVLWMRSYWWQDVVIRYSGRGWYGVESARGVLYANATVNVNAEDGWFHWSKRLNESRFPTLVVGSQDRIAQPGFEAHFSYWVPVLMFALLGAVSWIHPSKRFSLRILVLWMTLIAVLIVKMASGGECPLR
jgi:hypothetical protein